MVPGIQLGLIAARDGTRIGYQVRGEGPAVVLANGLGGTYLAIRYLYAALGAYKTICWDYRGLYTSGPASAPTANTVVHPVSFTHQTQPTSDLVKISVVAESIKIK